MRKLLVAAMTAGLLTIGGSALADVAGTHEDNSGTNANNVDCDKSATAQRAQVPTTGIFVAASGSQSSPQSGGAIVLCNEGGGTGPAPSVIEGRIIVAGNTSGGWVAADGDKNNPPEGRGWARVNINSSPDVRCGGPNDSGTSTNSETNTGTQAACG